VVLLYRLQDGNARRNQAVTKNLKAAKTDGTKLHRVLGTVNTGERMPLIEALAKPTGKFKMVVDIFGLLALLYYAFSIPFICTYIFGDGILVYRRQVMSVDFLVDGLVFIELLLRVFFFTQGFEGATDVDRLYHSKVDMMWDVVGSIPLELFVLLPDVPYESIFALRLIHLTRLGNVLQRVSQVEKHLQRSGMTFHRTSIMLFFSIASYLLINHWSACIFFAAHRYIERNRNSTWVIQDGYSSYQDVKGEHDVCSGDMWSCYQRSMYFVGTVLTSVGYGDINVFTDTEMILQVMLAIIGACAGANLSGQISAYLQTGDKSGLMAFKEKMRSVENYCNYRGLKMELKSSILTNYRTMWRNERRLGGAESSFLSALTKPLAETVALELNRDMMKTTLLLKTVRKSLHGRIALAMKPQILLPNYPIYSVGDSGHCVFFVQSGKVVIKTALNGDLLDTISVGTLRILERKQEFTGGLHTLGTHFGEFCVMSKLGLRAETATPSEITEVLYYDKEDIWNLFMRMPYQERYRFLQSLFTEVGGIPHSKDVVASPPNDALMEGSSIKNMYKLAAVVADDILATYGDPDDDRSDEGSLATATIKQEALARRISVLSNDGSEESGDQPTDMSKWSEALKAYDKTRLRRKSSRLNSASSKTVASAMSAPGSANAETSDDEDDDPDDMAALERRIRALFSYIDKDGSGSIDKNELMLSLLDLGIERSWADVDSMIDFADKDGDAEVDLEELVAAIMRELKKEAEAKRMAEAKMDAISDLDDEEMASVLEGDEGGLSPVEEQADTEEEEKQAGDEPEPPVDQSDTAPDRGLEMTKITSLDGSGEKLLAATAYPLPAEPPVVDIHDLPAESPPVVDTDAQEGSAVPVESRDSPTASKQPSTERVSSPVERYEEVTGDPSVAEVAPHEAPAPAAAEELPPDTTSAEEGIRETKTPAVTEMMNAAQDERSTTEPSATDVTEPFVADMSSSTPRSSVRKNSNGWLNSDDVPRPAIIDRKVSDTGAGFARRGRLPSLTLERRDSDGISTKGISGQLEDGILAGPPLTAIGLKPAEPSENLDTLEEEVSFLA
jgi:hypothetical protein